MVPYKIQRVEGVREIGSRERAGGTERKRKHGRATNETVHVDGEGFLEIYGTGSQKIEVSVSPASLSSAVARSNDFLAKTQNGSETFFVIANWKFGAMMGGVLTSFTALYVVGYSLELLKRLVLAFTPRKFEDTFTE